jgi:hypothetical protein
LFPPIPAIGGLSGEKEREEPIGALDAIDFWVGLGDGGFPSTGIGAGGENEGWRSFPRIWRRAATTGRTQVVSSPGPLERIRMSVGERSINFLGVYCYTVLRPYFGLATLHPPKWYQSILGVLRSILSADISSI